MIPVPEEARNARSSRAFQKIGVGLEKRGYGTRVLFHAAKRGEGHVLPRPLSVLFAVLEAAIEAVQHFPDGGPDILGRVLHDLEVIGLVG